MDMPTAEDQKRELQPHGPTFKSIPDYTMAIPYLGIDAENKSGAYENWKLEYYGEKKYFSQVLWSNILHVCRPTDFNCWTANVAVV